MSPYAVQGFLDLGVFEEEGQAIAAAWSVTAPGQPRPLVGPASAAAAGVVKEGDSPLIGDSRVDAKGDTWFFDGKLWVMAPSKKDWLSVIGTEVVTSVGHQYVTRVRAWGSEDDIPAAVSLMTMREVRGFVLSKMIEFLRNDGIHIRFNEDSYSCNHHQFRRVYSADFTVTVSEMS